MDCIYLGGRSQLVQVESKTNDVIKGGDLPACHSEGYAVVFIDDDTDNVAADEIETVKETIQEEAGISGSWLKDNQLCVSG